MKSKLFSNYIPELKAILLGRAKPSMVTINLTRRCNQHCIYCEIGSSPAFRAPDTLSVDDLRWIVDEMAASGIPKVALCGGEPFLFSGIFDVIRYAGQKGVYCAITTNGMVVPQLRVEELELLRHYRTRIHLSMDSFDEEVQCLTRGHQEALRRPLKAIDRFKAHGIPVVLLAAISRYNFDTLKDFVEKACEKGIRQVIFQPLIWSSNYPDRPALEGKRRLNVEPASIPGLIDELHAVDAYERQHPVRTNAYRILPWISQYLATAASPDGKWFFSELLPKFYCREVHAVIDISYDGGIQPCGLARATKTIFDDRSKGLLDIWEKASCEIREDMDNGNYREYCNSCCHKFSRNMMASAMRYPFRNRRMLGTMAAAVVSRGIGISRKKRYQI